MPGAMRATATLIATWLTISSFVISTTTAAPHSFEPSNNATFVPHHLARKPPPRSTYKASAPEPTSLQQGCGLQVPTAQSWAQNLPAIRAWIEGHWDPFLSNPLYKNFPNYLRDQYAPSLTPSSVFCDTIGACSLFSCMNLKADLPTHDKQMAYFVFEQIAGLDHLYSSMRTGLGESAAYMTNRIPALVDRYSSVSRIQQHLEDERKKELLGLAIGSSVLLMAGGMAGMVATFPAIGAVTTASSAAMGMVAATYVSIIGPINAARSVLPTTKASLKDQILAGLNEFSRSGLNNIARDMEKFMEGDRNERGLDLLDILKGEYFFRRDDPIQRAIRSNSDQLMWAGVVNALWAWERSYIIDANAPAGCWNDNRGPQESRVCLSERPNRAYYVYALDKSQEYAPGSGDKHARIHGPTGYRNLRDRDADAYGFSMEDVVRSSLFVHENKLQNAIERFDYKKVASALARGKSLGTNLGHIPGLFTLPVCRNPGGEAISSVWETKGRNYPCMCGEFGWNNNSWHFSKDETKQFLIYTGLMFSENWEHFCNKNGHCKGENGIDIHASLDRLRRPGDPQIPKDLKHPFKKCKQKTKHRAGDPSQDFSSNPPI